MKMDSNAVGKPPEVLGGDVHDSDVDYAVRLYSGAWTKVQ